MFDLINFKSPPRNNIFAPEWNYSLIETNINPIDFKSLTNFLMKKEKDILKLKSGSDGYTGLGKKSVTSRHHSYNIFDFKNKEIIKLKKEILNLHNLFLQKLKIKLPSKIFIKGWYNILRKGEKITPHLHGTSPDTYLGGHFCVKCKDTSTYYINPVNQINEPFVYKSLNNVGKLTLFQNCIPHCTDKTNTNRITIAFDLSLVHTNWVGIDI